MTTLADFLAALLHDGTVVFRAPPTHAESDRTAALALLRRSFTAAQLDIAGPSLPFHSESTVAAAEVVRQSCWFLVHRGAPVEELKRCLTLRAPASPEEHLSADVTLRFLPQIHRRAQALDPADALTTCLGDLLRRWPLAGVLADVAAPPLTVPDFGGHPGLQLLYAERLVRKQKSAWLPTGAARERVELVFRECGQERAPLLRTVTETERDRDEGQ